MGNPEHARSAEPPPADNRAEKLAWGLGESALKGPGRAAARKDVGRAAVKGAQRSETVRKLGGIASHNRNER